MTCSRSAPSSPVLEVSTLGLERAGNSSCSQNHTVVKRSCGIPAEERGLGALDTDEAADAEGARWEVIKALHPDMREALKAYVAETGRNPVLPDGRVIRWDGEKPNRKFGAFLPPEAVEAVDAGGFDDEYIAQWEASLEQQRDTTGAAA